MCPSRLHIHTHTRARGTARARLYMRNRITLYRNASDLSGCWLSLVSPHSPRCHFIFFIVVNSIEKEGKYYYKISLHFVGRWKQHSMIMMKEKHYSSQRAENKIITVTGGKEDEDEQRALVPGVDISSTKNLSGLTAFNALA